MIKHHPNVKDETGKTYGKWKVMQQGPSGRQYNKRGYCIGTKAQFYCLCTGCNSIKLVGGANLRRGGSKQCHSCFLKELDHKAARRKACLPKAEKRILGVRPRQYAKGVIRYEACITRNGQYHYLGTVSTPDEAARLHDKASFQFDGINAVLNFPEDFGKFANGA